MDYVLKQLFLGAKHAVSITKEEFDGIGFAVNLRYELMYVEEKYLQVLQNYIENEILICKSALVETIYDTSAWAHKIEDINDANRCFMNFLSSSRMYLDHVPQHLSRASQSDVLSNEFKRLASVEYDSQLGFRVMAALRNYAQHADFPVHSVTYTLGARKVESSLLVRHAVNLFLDPEQLVGDSKFKSSVLSEILGLKARINLSQMLREYVAALARLHTYVRSSFHHDLRDADSVVEDCALRFIRGTDYEPLGVAAVEIKDDGQYGRIHKIDREVSERRKHLESRCRLPINLGQHFISNDTVPDDLPSRVRFS